MRIFAYLVLLVLISCGKQDPSSQIDKLAGYWEIESVAMPDGEIKEFSMSTIVDFIEVSENMGVRTKVSPQLDGSFLNNGVAEKFEMKIENDSLQLYYKTPFNSWKETVLIATDSILKVLNRDDKIYTYSKFKKFELIK
jgi:hypothetical protein